MGDGAKFLHLQRYIQNPVKLTVSYFCEKASAQIFDKVLNTLLSYCFRKSCFSGEKVVFSATNHQDFGNGGFCLNHSIKFSQPSWEDLKAIL